MPQKVRIYFEFDEYPSIESLPEPLKTLSKKALESQKKAYAPYSRFNVGAAVLLDNGNIVEGNNQENAAYPSGLCAERVALFYANANFPEVPVKALAICAGKDNTISSAPISPCGSCRQVIIETEKRYNQAFQIVLIGNEKVFVVQKGSDFLPLTFSNEHLI